MIRLTRRGLIAGAGALGVAGALPASAASRIAPAAPDLFIGTGGDGHTFPGASLPFGMVQLSPDTDTARWATCSGYHHGDPSLLGFSHTHLSGTGIGDMLDVLVTPCRGPVMLQPGPLEQPDQGYRLRYSDELAEPGYYRVMLENGVLAELTVTRRTGIHRYSFPQGPAHLLVDLSHLVMEGPGEPALIDEARLALETDGTLTGARRAHRWAKGRRCFFAMQFSRQPDRIEFFGDDDIPAPGEGVSGKRLKAALHYDDAGSAPLVVRCGISAVDGAGARRNVSAEARHWDFDRYRRAATRAWSRELSRIRVAGGTDQERTVMATALYHASLGPTLFSDVDGRYVGLDRQVHKLAKGEESYTAYSLWDTYRAFHPLQTVIRPRMAETFAADLVRHTAQSPFGPPVWPLQGVETGCMIAWHGVAVMAEARAKGFRADYAAAWPGVKRRLFDWSTPNLDNSLGLPAYDETGFIPADRIFESVSRVLEYSYDDYAAAGLADAAGDTARAAYLRRRSGNWRNVFDPATGFARPRLADGTWAEPFTPNGIGHSPRWRDFTESNSWQATFLNQHDVPGLIAAMGGDAAFEAKLDGLFTADSTLPEGAPPDISGLVGQYAHGNEPSHHVAYLYPYCGAAWKTQAMVRRLMAEMYHDRPDGIIGNDDCGQMSAWFIFSALGFYPVDPVSATYVFGSPLFTRAEVDLGNGRRLTVEAPGNRRDTPYVRAIRWNDAPWKKGWIAHADLVRGGTLRFEMSAAPDKSFASLPEHRPGRPPSA
ncbi:alpha-1,2-mannosidase, putative [Novosphingobium sp. CF614]|uniref:GH92 family glycosyl hydrolase n=1 Tax=Novosphingobium sp. CF614 TaxID=1884364 RepID=UPI0008E18031|nr:GH92 family glycosyl hydrolase [Novosphingobium sp. CF614]SFF72903.1 alpha-1,2-mannosidase, putative [Novosphingobium sp. CF614]